MWLLQNYRNLYLIKLRKEGLSAKTTNSGTKGINFVLKMGSKIDKQKSRG
jgi:hypothetical protein